MAKYGDACNLFGGEHDVVAHKLEVLKGHCETEGRDYDEIEKTIIYSSVNPAEEPDQFLTDMEAMAKLGSRRSGSPTTKSATTRRVGRPRCAPKP